MLPYYMVSHRRAKGSRLRVLLNDVPIVHGPALGYVNTQEGTNELVVPGENVLTFELEKVPWERNAFWMGIWRDPAADDKLVDWSWGADTSPPEHQKLPKIFTATFDAPDTTFVPCFRNGDPVDFPCEGTKEQVDLVMQLQRAVEWKQVDELLELLALQHQELYEANHRPSGDHPSTQRAGFEEFFGLDVVTRPLDPKELHFERRAGGRVAIVTRIDGGAPVESITNGTDALGFTQRLAPDVRMTRTGGRWQLF